MHTQTQHASAHKINMLTTGHLLDELQFLQVGSNISIKYVVLYHAHYCLVVLERTSTIHYFT